MKRRNTESSWLRSAGVGAGLLAASVGSEPASAKVDHFVDREIIEPEDNRTENKSDEEVGAEITYTVEEAEQVFVPEREESFSVEDITAMEETEHEMVSPESSELTFKIEEEDPDAFLSQLAYRTMSKRRFNGGEPYYPYIDSNEEYRKKIFQLVNKIVTDYNTKADKEGLKKIDPYIILGIIAEESGFNSGVPDGLMQVTPIVVKHQNRGRKYGKMSDEENIRRGVEIFAHQLNLFKDKELALLAYGTGHGAMIRSFCEKYHKELATYGIDVDKKKKFYGFPDGSQVLYEQWLSEGKISLAELFLRYRKLYSKNEPGYHYLIPKMVQILAEDLRKKYVQNGEKRFFVDMAKAD